MWIRVRSGYYLGASEEIAQYFVGSCNAQDMNLQSGELKRIRYKILFLKRDHEAVLAEGEELIVEPLTANEYTAHKISEFLEQLASGEVRSPTSWTARGYPPSFLSNGRLLGLPEEDGQYLRVEYEVLTRFIR